ncbi:hypothetical protein ACT3SP_03610 [Brachybacterium sp. AOP43-C2-M15]|uniref:hypothetical protein n=1 Tax=Brachybacterium sp. AOP43-C2-M15 TaxID=3457661 RepID=UPI004033C930
MHRRHQIRTLTAIGLSAPLLLGLGVGGIAPALAGSEPTDLFTTGPRVFAAPTDTAVTAEEVADSLYEYAADPSLSDDAHCAEALDLEDTDAVTRCTVIGWSGEQETYYGYIAPAAAAGDDYWLYFSEGAPLPADAAAALNDGLNGTGAYPVFGEQDEQREVLAPELATERANFVLDGIGRDDLRVQEVAGDVDLTTATPVRGSAIEEGSGRTVGVTLLPIPTQGEAPAMLVSIDGP